MSSAGLDRVLAGLVVAMAATGLLSLRAGSPASAWLFVLHGVLAGALLAATAVKLRRSVPRAAGARRYGRLALGLAVSLGVAAALTGGYLWVASGELLTLGSWTVLTLHMWVGLALVPLVVVHLLPRRWRLLRPRVRASAGAPNLSRRTLIASGGLAVAGVGLFGLAAVAERVRGGERRFTGSRWLPAGGIPPVTTFFGEGTPSIDPAAWRLTVADGASATHVLSLDGLRAIGEVDLTAILDCTSGWALETGWRGVPLASVVGDTRGRRVLVRSVTGWSTVIEPHEVGLALLATSVAGQALPVANGAPCRLVVPDRRGLDWVKWVTEIRIV